MGRSPCCSKEGLNRGAWTAIEDKILTAYIKAHGEGKWRSLPKRAGLKRCGKSCRLRWLNYLRPDIKRGNISHDEEELIIRLHRLLGNRWSLIAGRLPGRTDNEIKNYWNTTLGKKARANQSSSGQSKQSPTTKSRTKKPTPKPKTKPPAAIRTKAFRCTKNPVPATIPPPSSHSLSVNSKPQNSPELTQAQQRNTHNSKMEEEACVGVAYPHDLDSQRLGNAEFQPCDFDAKGDCYNHMDFPQPFYETMLADWMANDFLDDNNTMDLGSLAALLDYEEWPREDDQSVKI